MQNTNTRKIEDVKAGEFIRIVTKNGPGREVYIKGDYQRDLKKWECDAESDISKSRYLKKGTLVLIGFDY
tara:strand:+ start:3931 stop:4140 length:210 start_codon:yes stop_codon:yes gene_type:complete